MKFIELQEALELEINELDSIATKPLTSDMEHWFNAALDKFIKTRYSGLNIKRRGFEQDQKRIDDLRTLIIDKSYSFTIHNGEYTAELPTDYCLTLGETSIIYSDTDPCWPKGPNGMPRTKHVDVLESTIENFDSQRNNSLSEYRLHACSARPLRLIKGNNVKLYTDENYSIKNYILTYLRTPKRISLTTAPFDEYKDMPVHTHLEIVKLAAELYLENRANPRYQSYLNEVNTME